jgi:hypothetical protein
MPRSLARGDYRLLMAIESASQPNAWYRILVDPRTNVLSCDCPSWTFGQRDQSRACKHTDLAEVLVRASAMTAPGTPGTIAPRRAEARDEHPLVATTRQQWAGLAGSWSIEERDVRVWNEPYHFVLLHLVTGNGALATGVVAFASAAHPTMESRMAGVAGWAGYAIAAEVARQAGYPLMGQPPEHFKTQRRTDGRVTGPGEADLSLSGILRVGDQVRLHDGLTPQQRAENTLQLFLGDLYPQLQQQGFLDVSSSYYTREQRVYRLRRDPTRQRDRRVRVFEHERYVHDYCIVRGQDVPEADHWLTVFLGLISDEREVLRVVRHYNVFPPYSDGHEEETASAVWLPRAS